jgi:hypothetical protein
LKNPESEPGALADVAFGVNRTHSRLEIVGSLSIMSRFHSLTTAGLVLLVTSALCSPGVCEASNELDYFHVCVTQEIPAALRRFVAVDGYDSLRRAQADIVDSVFSICRQRAIDSSHQVDEQIYVSKAVGALFEQIPKFVELEQQWKIDPECLFDLSPRRCAGPIANF